MTAWPVVNDEEIVVGSLLIDLGSRRVFVGGEERRLTKKQFEKGNIPVISYPAGNLKTAGFTVVSSYKTQMMLLVDLVARKGSGANIRPHLPFWVGLVRAHNKPNGHWLVNYWIPDWSPPVPLAGGGG